MKNYAIFWGFRVTGENDWGLKILVHANAGDSGDGDESDLPLEEDDESGDDESGLRWSARKKPKKV